MFGIKILGTGSYVPAFSADNNALAAIMDTNDEWIRTRTGIARRGYSSGETTFEMGAAAAKRALAAANITADKIGLIVAVTITNDFATPSLSCMIQREIGATCAAFDVVAACSGFVYGLDTAKRFLETDKNLDYVLVAASDTLSRIVDFSDRSSAILFGDGAAAVVITRDERTYGSFLGADGGGSVHLYAKNAPRYNPVTERYTPFNEGFPGKDNVIIQNGQEVYKFAVNALQKASIAAATSAGIDINDIDMFLPHQANLRIIRAAAKGLKIPDEKFFVNIDRHGNTSGVSIPLALDEAISEGKVKRGDKLCFVGFGAGLTYGAVVLEY
ncbi:MAG: ketoacyl-ACP synthase III [Ruminococcus sp.]|jgi:3-oxoacyl-[acyl-carrier-protein] synthase-3|nr:ketoacyl-ACP synthase III [Ruminococcus sp.]